MALSKYRILSNYNIRFTDQGHLRKTTHYFLLVFIVLFAVGVVILNSVPSDYFFSVVMVEATIMLFGGAGCVYYFYNYVSSKKAIVSLNQHSISIEPSISIPFHTIAKAKKVIYEDQTCSLFIIELKNQSIYSFAAINRFNLDDKRVFYDFIEALEPCLPDEITPIIEKDLNL